jgi:hypothetical protein
MNNFMIFCRLPRVNDSGHIEWVEWISPNAFQRLLNLLGTNTSNIANLLAALLAHPIPSIAAERSCQDKQIIMSLQSFAAYTIVGNSGLSLHSMLRMLNLYHPSANIDLASLIQTSLLLIGEPCKDHPLRFYHNFDRSKYSDAAWDLSNANFYDCKHPLQKFLKNSHKLALIGYIRSEHEGAENYKRTILNVIKRTSIIKMGEALSRNGITQVTPLIILHRTFCDVVAAKGFQTQNPQEADYQRLYKAYQQALVAKQQETCSLIEMKARLDQLKYSILNYSHSGQMQSLNEVVGENGHEFINMLSDDHYNAPYDNCINLEHKRHALKLKHQIHQQIEALVPRYRQSFCLTALGYNDAKVARKLGVSSSTTKRQRIKIVKKIIKVTDQNQQEIEAAYLQVMEEYFTTKIVEIRCQILAEHYSLTTETLIDIISAINQRWNIALVPDQELYLALCEMFQREGVA